MDFSIEFNLDSIEEVAEKIIELSDSRILLFYGEMGLGKTTLIKALVKALGGITDVTSPTFALVNEYEVGGDLVYHFDFYRIEDPVEVLDIGFDEYLDSGHWVFIEWPARIDDYLPERAVKIFLKEGKKCSRALDLELVKNNN